MYRRIFVEQIMVTGKFYLTIKLGGRFRVELGGILGCNLGGAPGGGPAPGGFPGDVLGVCFRGGSLGGLALGIL